MQSAARIDYDDVPVSPLEEILLLAVGASDEPARLARLQHLLRAEAIDWPALWSLAATHDVGPLLARELAADAVRDLVPSDALHAARTTRLRTMKHNMVLHAELQRVADLLSSRSIPVVALKGTDLALRLYGALDARRCGDIDILVPEDRWDEARRILRADGYAPAGQLKPGVAQHTFHDAPLIRTVGASSMALELHRDLNDPRFVPVDRDALWRRVHELNDPGATLASLPDEELLLYLAIHLPKHGGELRLLADIDRLVTQRGPLIDWRGVIDLAGRWEARRLLYCALVLSRSLLGTSVPEWVLTEIQPGVWTSRIVDRLAGPRVTLHPSRIARLQENRSRLAYCVMLDSTRRGVRSYRRYLLAPPIEDDLSRIARPAVRLRRLASGVAWTILATGAALAEGLLPDRRAVRWRWPVGRPGRQVRPSKARPG